MIDPGLLRDLCCPETRQPLQWADAALIEKLNAHIEAGQVRNRAGLPVSDKLEGGLVREDGKLLYPVRRQLPILLIDEAIALEIKS